MWGSKQMYCPGCGKYAEFTLESEYLERSFGESYVIRHWRCQNCGYVVTERIPVDRDSFF